MNLLRKTYIAVVAVLGLAVNANAISLTVGDGNYLGSIVNGIPAGGGTPSNEFKWLNELILVVPGASVPSTNPAGETLNRSSNNFGILSAALTEAKSEPALGTYIVGSDDLYLLGKYGNGAPGGQASHVWYLGTIAVGTSVSLPGAALSHDTLFTGDRPDDVPPPSVPEGGIAVTLLGVALIGLGATRRFIRA
jgi:hypothetical protein